jgi:transposase
LPRGPFAGRSPSFGRALQGRFGSHHALLASEMLALIDHIEGSIDRLSARIEEVIAPFAEEVKLLDTIPGVDRRTAEVIIAECGPDMSRFPSASHLASWAGMCPGNNESGGKRRSGKTRKGSKWLRKALVEAAHGAARSKGTYLAAHYARIRGQRGPAKAAVATGHSILVIGYHVLSTNWPGCSLNPERYL